MCMFGFMKKSKEISLYAPVNGKMINIEDVSDKVFSSKMMGDGVAFQFNDSYVLAPCDCTVTLIPDTLHAVGLKTTQGLEILVHIGLDTVQLNGQGFKKLVNQGQSIKQGTPMIEINHEFMKANHIDLTTPMVILNKDDFDIMKITPKHVTANQDIVIECKKKS